MKDVERLLDIHGDIGGNEVGRRYGVEVLNKSAVLFACANWEAFVEDVATQSVDHIVSNTDDYKAVPKPLLRRVAAGLEKHNNELKVWDLAGDGWKQVIGEYRDLVIREEIAPFNTPKPHNVRQLFKRLLNIENICDQWRWRGMAAQTAHDKLKKFVETRGAIAHRGDLARPITKAYVEGHVVFIVRLAVRTSNVVRDAVRAQVGTFPWARVRLGNFR